MTNADLAKYVKQQIKAGYAAEQIKSSLLKQGYKKNTIDAAIKQAKTKLPLLYIAIALVVLIIIVLTVLVYIKMMPEDVKLPEKIEEKILPEEKTVPEKEIDLEKIPILPAEKMPLIQSEEAQEFESSIKIEEIRKISTTEPDRAEALCTDLEFRTERDNCYLQIAGSSAKPEFCAKVSEPITRDTCYLNFAAAGIDTCDNIKNNSTRRACNQMIAIKEKGAFTSK